MTTVAGAGGIQLAVTERGDLGAPPVVLVHGYPDTSSVWDLVVEGLASRYHVITYDVRGAGASSAPASTEGYRLELLVDDFEAVIDVTSPDRPVHVVGHDWGSIQTWEAVTEPRLAHRVASFTSISGPPLDHAGLWARAHLRSQPGQGIRQLFRSWYIWAFHMPLAPVAARAAGSLLGDRQRRAWAAAIHRGRRGDR